MSDIEFKIHELMQKIDGLTKNIADKVANNILEEADFLLNQRHILIAELITLPVTDDDKINLMDYINQIRQRDSHIIQVLLDDRAKVKNALSNVNKVKGYIVE